MNYYYDLVLNFSDESLNFYEWDDYDTIEYFKKIPFFQITTKAINDFFSYKIAVTKEFVEAIKNKSKLAEDIKGNFAIFTDKNNAIALEFDDDGKEIARSFLEIDDEISLLEIVYTLKLEKIEYRKINKIVHRNSLRQEDKIRLLINTEIKNLLINRDYKKLNYLYIEWFGKKAKDEESILGIMSKALKKEIGEKEIKIYNLIKLSYSNV